MVGYDHSGYSSHLSVYLVGWGARMFESVPRVTENCQLVGGIKVATVISNVGQWTFSGSALTLMSSDGLHKYLDFNIEAETSLGYR